ncbi:ABC transporter permease [Frateuria sp. GZRR35]|uniref:ABC transporter permease n=1 Tax=Frateuria sp. GZRR35 TaxID=3351536 RepID=UPI003EDC4AE9
MPLQPILASLRHHKLTATLLTLQVAITLAIVCNVVYMIASRVERISVSTGLAEDELSTVPSRNIDKVGNPDAQLVVDLAALRAIPGVRAAVAVSYSMPLNRNEWSQGICPDKQALDRAIQRNSLEGSGCVEPSVYDGTLGLIDTWGLDLVEGRGFTPDDYPAHGKPVVAIITRALAQRLYPGQRALGQSMYDGDRFIRVVGIVKRLVRPDLRADGSNDESMLLPQPPDSGGALYVLRSAPQDRQRVLAQASAALMRVNPQRLIKPERLRTYSEIRASYFQRDTTMIGLLIASALGLLFVTALGIAGLANFWVQQRTRTIGIRRAIGATRADIRCYFQAENFLIVSAGVLLGVLLAVGLNLLLMSRYELPRLPLWYLPVGALALWALGQLSVLAPALRASRVPPVVATRSV